MDFEFSFNDLKEPDLENNFHEYIKSRAQKIKIYTTIKVKREDEQVVARYTLSDQLAKVVDKEVVDYLNAFDLNLENEDYQNFTIYKVFHSWPHCAEHLKAESLKRYFGKDSHEFDLSFLKKKSPKNFIKVEERMIDQIVDKKIVDDEDLENHELEEVFYQPVPIEEKGTFLGITYLIYKMTELDEEEKEILEKFQALLEKRYA